MMLIMLGSPHILDIATKRRNNKSKHVSLTSRSRLAHVSRACRASRPRLARVSPASRASRSASRPRLARVSPASRVSRPAPRSSRPHVALVSSRLASSCSGLARSSLAFPSSLALGSRTRRSCQTNVSLTRLCARHQSQTRKHLVRPRL